MSFKSVFRLNESKIGRQGVPSCWTSKTERSFSKLGPSAWFGEVVVV